MRLALYLVPDMTYNVFGGSGTLNPTLHSTVIITEIISITFASGQ